MQRNDVIMRSKITFSKRLTLSVYSTIGYGNMAADTTECRVATVIYGALGIPLFFAFVKEEGNLLRVIFIRLYKLIRHSKWIKRFGSKTGMPSSFFYRTKCLIKKGFRTLASVYIC